MSSGRQKKEGGTQRPSEPPAAAAEEEGCRSALLVVGTYHSVMAGLVFRRKKFEMLFSIKHHVGCINSVAVGERYMASAGTDERVFLFTNKCQQRLTPREREKLRAAGASLGVRLADLGHVSPPSEVR
ncbi:protein MAK11, partial [Trypanosoma grayi]|uniref:protein MAK11 n=1 Tax=Trypanosoma grayi TaxID=71804 RepID=UPI0004F405C4